MKSTVSGGALSGAGVRTPPRHQSPEPGSRRVPSPVVGGDFVTLDFAAARTATLGVNHDAPGKLVLDGVLQRHADDVRRRTDGGVELSAEGVLESIRAYGSEAIYSPRKLAVGQLSHVLEQAHEHVVELERRIGELERRLQEGGSAITPAERASMEEELERMRSRLLIVRNYVDTNAPTLGHLRDESYLARAQRRVRRTAEDAAPYVSIAAQAGASTARAVGAVIARRLAEYLTPPEQPHRE